MFLQRDLVLVYEISLYYNIILMLNINIVWHKVFQQCLWLKISYSYLLPWPRIIIALCIIIIIIVISFMQDIYTYIPETNHVPREYSVSAILSLLFMVSISLVPALALLYFYVSTVFCSSFTSWFPGMLLMHFLNYFEMVPVAPIITGITLVFTFHMRCISVVRSSHFKIFSASFLTIFLSHYYYYYYYYYFAYCLLAWSSANERCRKTNEDNETFCITEMFQQMMFMYHT